MKVEINPAELLSATTMGVIAGLLSHAGNERWHLLGRDAYLAHYSQVFDKQMANQPSLTGHLVVGAIVALFGFAVYKGLVSGYELILSLYPNKNGTEQE
jgi:H+/Cl- antiporter ClcA